MKNKILTSFAGIIAFFITPCSKAAVFYTDIGSFTTGNFTVDSGSGYMPTQSASGLTSTITASTGDGFYGEFTAIPKDWSGYASFALLMSSTASTAMPFTILFQDSTAAIAASYTGSTAGLTSTPTSNLLSYVSQTYSGSLSDIKYISLNWDNQGSLNSTTLVGIQGVVPEPATGSLLLLGGLGIFALRRLRKL